VSFQKEETTATSIAARCCCCVSLVVAAAVSGLPSLFATLFYCLPKAMRHQQHQQQQQHPATPAIEGFFLFRDVPSKVKQMGGHNSNCEWPTLRQLAATTSRHSSNIN